MDLNSHPQSGAGKGRNGGQLHEATHFSWIKFLHDGNLLQIISGGCKANSEFDLRFMFTHFLFVCFSVEFFNDAMLGRVSLSSSQRTS